MQQYSKEEIRKIFDELPKELRGAVLSPDTADSIHKIADRNGIKENDIPDFATLVGDVLMGLLPPDDLPKALSKELNINKEKGNKISQEVTRLILHSVESHLTALYNKTPKPADRNEIKKEPPVAKKTEGPQKDTYREQFE